MTEYYGIDLGGMRGLRLVARKPKAPPTAKQVEKREGDHGATLANVPKG